MTFSSHRTSDHWACPQRCGAEINRPSEATPTAGPAQLQLYENRSLATPHAKPLLRLRSCRGSDQASRLEWIGSGH
eukprot:CAMPEP_0174719090 /NCGR_PEP_ID=MMETSP1094-20130205/30788_1 /TAXON_ID=156173 /ORGANISM="Chrysochromulina brevifilum, Strain UTEX LB 985" /LENGTH=75 /DNA_ID=CAMNT_0015919353 /DNA_START=87 /DNA_END=314 /DNA_ORIENTATION=-